MIDNAMFGCENPVKSRRTSAVEYLLARESLGNMPWSQVIVALGGISDDGQF
ncbi:MAG: hypothetical protein ABR915_06960 [Thermoguttaceae bacterium]|jgi:hypothetical protein